MISIQNLTKVYHLNKRQMKKLNRTDKTKIAVNHISFDIADGQIFALLGPNGAGKTTTLRMIATLLQPTEGQITVNGHDTVTDSLAVRRSIGFLTNELKLDDHFTPNYIIRFFGQLHGMAAATIDSRKKELFDTFGISDYADKKISQLSTGMKQKLSIAVSLIHDPEIVIFDEPTNGLDVITAKTVTDYLLTLKQQGKLVIISTHIMNVAERLADQIVIIIDGQIVATGTADQINHQTGMDNLEDSFFKLYYANNHSTEGDAK